MTTVKRIVGDNETEVNSYPWQVGLVDPAWQHPKKPFCGGSIISNRHILTAAHCTMNMTTSTLRVLLGEHDTTDSVPDIRTISAITDHPNYDSNKTVNDISILTLNSPITFSSIMSPVCLPEGIETTSYLKLICNPQVILRGLLVIGPEQQVGASPSLARMAVQHCRRWTSLWLKMMSAEIFGATGPGQ